MTDGIAGRGSLSPTEPDQGHTSHQRWPRQAWFDRTFAFPVPVERFSDIIERVRGTPARLEERLATTTATTLRDRKDDRWSIQENVGHLLDLEPLWLGRAHDLAAGLAELRSADLENRASHEAAHNDTDLDLLLSAFRQARRALVEELESFNPRTAGFASRHPRLGTPMTAVDLAFFVAEHDDHHMARISELLR